MRVRAWLMVSEVYNELLSDTHVANVLEESQDVEELRDVLREDEVEDEQKEDEGLRLLAVRQDIN